MTQYDSATYGERIAPVYDDIMPFSTDATARAVDGLASLAAGGSVLELGIGTGRVALPLAARGLSVQGIDTSPAMTAVLRGKPGGQQIVIHEGDFATTVLPGPFSLIYVVFNTFFVLLTQDAQVRCFENVAQMLGPDGQFAIEAFVPDLTRYVRHQSIVATEVGLDRARIDISLHDPVGQRVRAQQLVLSGQGISMYPVELRYAWPSELDLMARLAGLTLRDRWEDWTRAPFRASSAQHISIYGRSSPA